MLTTQDTIACSTDAVPAKTTVPGAVVVRYRGPHTTNEPKMFFRLKLIASDSTPAFATALVTDGRLSGDSHGPYGGYEYLEAIDGGPLAIIDGVDLLEIYTPKRSPDVVGLHGCECGQPMLRRTGNSGLHRVVVLRCDTREHSASALQSRNQTFLAPSRGPGEIIALVEGAHELKDPITVVIDRLRNEVMPTA